MPSQSGVSEPLKIAISCPLNRVAGVAIRRGAELAIEELDYRAGSHQVELSFLDSDLSDEVPIEGTLAAEAVADPRVVAYVGPLHSTLGRFSLPLLNEAGPRTQEIERSATNIRLELRPGHRFVRAKRRLATYNSD